MWKSSMAVLVMAAGLGACAGLNTVQSDVSTYSQWPAQRSPMTYHFERLPSQQARPLEQERLENAARPALESAGFKEAADPKTADVTVQVGVRASRADRSPWNDPFWWHGGFYTPYPYRYGPGPFWGPGMGYHHFDTPRYEREVALLIRDRGTGQPLYEARASNDGNSPGNETLLAAMFEAAMKDFPHSGVNPRRVSIQLAK